MDLNTFRTIVEIVAVITFAGIVVWALTRDRADLQTAARLPFDHE